MLEITLSELEDLRVKLLAGILSDALTGDMASAANLLAKDLDGLATLINAQGTTCIPVDATYFGHLLQDAVRDSRLIPAKL